MAALRRRVLSAGAQILDRLVRRIEYFAGHLDGAVFGHAPRAPDRPRLLDDGRGVAEPRCGLEAIGVTDAEGLREDRHDVAHIRRLAREGLPALEAGLVRRADAVG